MDLRNKKIQKILFAVILSFAILILLVACIFSIYRKERERITIKLKYDKFYETLNDVLARSVKVYGPYEKWFKADSTESSKALRFGNRISQYLKISKNCGVAVNNGCLGNDLDQREDLYKIVMKNGLSLGLNSKVVYIALKSEQKTLKFFGVGHLQYKIVDNKLDTWCKNLPFEEIVKDLSDPNKRTCTSTWILRYSNREYLKFTPDGKCKNGKQITEESPFCK